MYCKKCGGEHHVKAGFISGEQRYLCKDCGCKFVPTRHHGKPTKDKLLAVWLYLHGLSFRTIAKLFKVSPKKVIIGIDVETDVGSFTLFYEGVKRGVPLLLALFDKLDVRGTFYFTGHSARENPEIARLVANSTSEVGCHSLFHETVGDALFPIPGVYPLLPDEVYPRIKLATEWVEAASGVRPVSFRCPRLWGSTAVVNALEKLGYTTDASYPMYFYRERFAPYHPSSEDWTKEGNMKLLEITNFADMEMESQDSPLERDCDQWPLFRTKGAEYFVEMVRKFATFTQEKTLPAVVCLYIHPWEFIPMEKFIGILKQEGAEFVTAKKLY